MEHGNFTWLKPQFHCGAVMYCTVADRHVVLSCCNKVTMCHQMKQMNYVAIVEERYDEWKIKSMRYTWPLQQGRNNMKCGYKKM